MVDEQRFQNRRVLVINRNYVAIGTINLKRAIKKLYLGHAVIVLPPNNTNDRWIEIDCGSWEKWIPSEDNEDVIHGTSRNYIIPEIIKISSFAGRLKKGIALNKRNIFHRDDGVCQYCGKNVNNKDRSVDHLLPSSRGGLSTWINLVLCCRKCNIKKGNKTPEETGMKLLRQPFEPKIDVFYVQGKQLDSWKYFLN